MSDEKLYTGGCHCGAVKFEATGPAKPDMIKCNCSMCDKTGYIHLFVTGDNFRLLKGEENLELYQFNSMIAKHYFCKTCGIKSFYVPRSHPDGYSLHAGCIDNIDLSEHDVKPFDGGNWEKNVDTIR